MCLVLLLVSSWVIANKRSALALFIWGRWVNARRVRVKVAVSIVALSIVAVSIVVVVIVGSPAPSGRHRRFDFLPLFLSRRWSWW